MKLLKSNLNHFLEKYTQVREKTIRNHFLEIGALQSKGINEYQRINGMFQKRMKDLNLETKDSLLLSRLWEYEFRHLHWLIFTTISGMYKEAIMEMRFILESWVQAYYIDLKFSNLSLEGKIDILKEKEMLKDNKNKTKKMNWYGFQLFQRAFVNEEFQKQIYGFYSELCDFSHGSHIELLKYREIINTRQKMMLADPGYETEMFKKSYSFFLKMHDYLMKLVENIFDTEL